ncbi:MAG: Spy/CpxP family protein refolding chaperone [Gemmatimonadota bacterium]|nr:Spy/CpxP family protein refolding chaperone [Gemmatimonadota bacterium]
MNVRIAALAAAVVFAAACDNASTAPASADESALLLFNQQATLDSASLVPRGPAFDNDGPPAALQLTDAQKAAIKALHDAFAAAHKTQFDQLKAIHDQAHAAAKAGKTREEVRAILEKGRPIMESMKADFEALRAAVAAILTAEQKAWAASHQRQGPGPMGAPRMPGRP